MSEVWHAYPCDERPSYVVGPRGRIIVIPIRERLGSLPMPRVVWSQNVAVGLAAQLSGPTIVPMNDPSILRY